MRWVLRCEGRVGAVIGSPQDPTGLYLREYDPEFADGRGISDWTPDRDEAMHFDSFADAMECWKQVPDARPIREDGAPNRPLTAYSVSPEQHAPSS